MSQFISSIKEVKKNYKKYDAWEQYQADDAAKRQYLSTIVDTPQDKVELTKKKAETVFRAADLLDKRSEDNCQNMERTTSLISMAALLPLTFVPSALAILSEQKGKAISPKLKNIISIGSILGIVAGGVGLTLWGTSKQKEASRIGRFQAKQHELQDTKNFVIYTPEQIEAAKILAKTLPDKKDKKSLSDLFKNMKQMSKDKVEYKKWLEERVKNPEDVQKILNANFTPEQLKQGEDDKELITNIVKDVNIKAEDYSEKAESVFDTMTILSFLGTIPIAMGVKKVLKNVKSVPIQALQFVPIASGLIFGISMLAVSTKEKKKASRVGRYVKRQEILKNAESLMAFSPEQMEKAKDVKAEKLKQGFFDKLGGNFSFLKTYLKDKKQYNKYLKTEAKENEKLYEALAKTEVSPEQMKEAKHLQKNTFKTFEKMDEMSQRYSEDTEAATEIAKQAFGLAWDVVTFGGAIILGNKFAKGKLPIDKIMNSFANLTLDKSSYLRKAANDLRDVLKNDKQLRKEFNKTFAKNSLEKLFGKSSKNSNSVFKNEKISKILNELEGNATKSLINAEESPDITQTFRKILTSQFKKGKFFTWARNLTADIGKLWMKSKLKEERLPVPANLKGKENYKTLIKSVYVGIAPVLAVLFGVPYAFSSWLANVQIKAGRIGIMKAMDEVDNPKLFVNQESNN